MGKHYLACKKSYQKRRKQLQKAKKGLVLARNTVCNVFDDTTSSMDETLASDNISSGQCRCYKVPNKTVKTESNISVCESSGQGNVSQVKNDDKSPNIEFKIDSDTPSSNQSSIRKKSKDDQFWCDPLILRLKERNILKKRIAEIDNITF